MAIISSLIVAFGKWSSLSCHTVTPALLSRAKHMAWARVKTYDPVKKGLEGLSGGTWTPDAIVVTILLVYAASGRMGAVSPDL